jgi:hypothetical protein
VGGRKKEKLELSIFELCFPSPKSRRGVRGEVVLLFKYKFVIWEAESEVLYGVDARQIRIRAIGKKEREETKTNSKRSIHSGMGPSSYGFSTWESQGRSKAYLGDIFPKRPFPFLSNTN